jgi:transcriptional regulator with XRE-family HTH domain
MRTSQSDVAGRAAQVAAGHRIRSAREKRGLLQREVAEQLDVHFATIAKWESGDSAVPYRRWPRLAEILQIEPPSSLGRSSASESEEGQGSVRSYHGTARALGARPAAAQWWTAIAARLSQQGIVYPELEARRTEAFSSLAALMSIRGVQPDELSDDALTEALEVAVKALESLGRLASRTEGKSAA